MPLSPGESRTQPSWKSGFARSAGESANPGLFEGLVGAWVPRLGPTGGTLRDVSGYGIHGTLVNMELDLDWITGERGYATSYNGTDEQISIPDAPHLRIPGSWTIHTVASILTYPTFNQWSGFLVKGDSGETAGINHNYSIIVDHDIFGTNENIIALYEDSSGANTTAVYSWTPILNEFLHWTAVHDAEADTLTLYLNGEQVVQNASATATPDTGSPNIVIANGVSDGGGGSVRNLNASTSSSLLYDRALSHDEVQQLYQDELAPFRKKSRSFFFPQTVETTPTAVGAFRLGTSRVEPSWQNGFARSASESANPGLFEGLIGSWMPSFGPTGKTLRDVSGYRNDGTFTNMFFNDWVIGERGYVLDFDGSDDHIVVSDRDLLSPKHVTISSWVNFTDISAGSTVHVVAMKDHEYVLQAANSADAIQVGVSFTGTTFNILASSTSATSLEGEWHHIAMTWDGEVLSVYIDGVEDATTSAFSGSIQNTSNDLAIGIKIAEEGGTVNPLLGQISSVNIYDRALSHNEIQQLYVDTLAPFRKKQLSFSVSEVPSTDAGIGAFRRTSQVRPSWQSGFARSQGESANPNLYDGLEFSITPFLGPTGFTTVRDAISNRNHATTSGAMTASDWVVGERGPALALDGTNDYLDVGTLDYTDYTAFSVSIWIKPSGTKDANARLFSIFHSGTQDDIRIFSASGTDLGWTMDDGDASGTINTTITDDVWHHIVGTHDGSRQKLYVDGVLIGDTAKTFNYAGLGGLTVIGTRTTSSGPSSSAQYGGDYGSVAVYDKALTHDEVQQLYVDDLAPFRKKRLSFSVSTIEVPSTDAGIGAFRFGTSQVRPSWQSGFARSQSESANPKLWDSLVGFWAPSFGPTGITTLRDVSGHKSHATFNGTMTADDWIVGEKGYALDFDGTDDRLEVPDSDVLSITGELSLFAWVQTTSSVTGANEGIVSKYRSQSGSVNQRSYTLVMTETNGFLAMALSDDGTFNAAGSLASTTAINDGKLHYVGMTYKPSTYSRLWVDGIMVAEDTTAILASLADTAAPFWIGTQFDSTTSNFNFDGKIGDVSLHDRAISHDEIQQIYQDSVAPFRKKRLSFSVSTAAEEVTPTIAGAFRFGTSQVRPSWQSGFARSQGESANPGLFEGLIGAWIPQLGPTGITTLRDVSGYKRDGTFAGSAEAGDWFMSERGYTRHFEGSDDHVLLTGLPFISPPFTLSAWVRDDTPTFDNQYRHIFSRGSVFENNTNFALATRRRSTGSENRIRFSWRNGSTLYGTEGSVSQYTAGEWMHIAAVIDSNFDSTTYLNGVPIHSTTGNATPVDGSQVTRIGGPNDRDNAEDDYFNGLIGSSLIHDRALTQNEVQRLFQDSLAPFRKKRLGFSVENTTTPAAATIAGAFRFGTSQVRPGWQSGFARSQGESANPGLFEGLVGAWMTSFGPTALVLRDVSGKKRDGTLTSMALGDWVVGQRGHNLDYDGVNDHVLISERVITGYPFTLNAWVKSGTQDGVAVGLADSSATNVFYGIRQSNAAPGKAAVFTRNTGYGEQESVVSIDDDEWHLLSGVFTATHRTIFVDGKQESSPDPHSNAYGAGVNNLEIGRVGDSSPSNEWSGSLGDVMAYDRELSPDEIAQLFQDSVAPFRKKKVIGISTEDAGDVGVAFDENYGVVIAWIRQFVASKLITTESILSIASTATIPVENVLGLASSSTIPVENTLGVINNSKVIVEYVSGLVLSNQIPVENTAALSLNNLIPVEWIISAGVGGVLASPTIIVESTSQVIAGNNIPVENTSGLVISKDVPVENVLALASSLNAIVEYNRGVIADNKVLVEYVREIDFGITVIVEHSAAGAVALNANKLIVIESTTQTASANVIPVENVLGIGIDKTIPIGNLSIISANKDIEVSFTAQLSLNKDLVFNTLLGISLSKTLLIEYVRQLDVDTSVIVESLAGFSGDEVIPVEWLGDAIVLDDLFTWIVNDRLRTWNVKESIQTWTIKETDKTWTITQQ